MTPVLNTERCAKVCVVPRGSQTHPATVRARIRPSECPSSPHVSALRVYLKCEFQVHPVLRSCLRARGKNICGCQIWWEVINHGDSEPRGTLLFPDLYLTCGRGRPGQV